MHRHTKQNGRHKCRNDLIRILKDYIDFVNQEDERVIFLAVLIQAALDKSRDSWEETQEDFVKPDEFLQDESVRKFYYNLYGIRNLPVLCEERYGRAIG